ncbi:hypothetical protein EW146_g9026 [Bondarzewia mesenterica]|uniref:Ubiquitin 3 binding protein But2 C-terminal domain-containing protein n=1 Tax=Bondarzewia mesenterica TaxID=1095465 RepID=A0A4S4LA17_9AGAM|nr:hypothetical protein EW146_g9026 [Bondarzewia mesenterica]
MVYLFASTPTRAQRDYSAREDNDAVAIPLLDDGSVTVEAPAFECNYQEQYRRTILHTSFYVLALLSLILSALNLFLLVAPFVTDRFAGRKLHELEFISPYIGLDKLSLPPTSPDTQIVNFPRMLARVQRSAPDRVFWPATPDRQTFTGTILPDARHFAVSHDLSTIAEFRVLDYAMERCRIAITLPLRNTSNADFNSQNLRPSNVHVWRLDTREGPVDPRVLSWRTMPHRATFLGALTANAGSTARTAEFACEQGALVQVEFSCSPTEEDMESGSCFLDFWQEPKLPGLGKSRFAANIDGGNF